MLKTKNYGKSVVRSSGSIIIIGAIGYFGYAAGGIIHVFLVIAVIAIILRVIKGRSV